MSNANKISFKMISFMHETMYGMLRDASPALVAAGLKPGQRALEVECGPGFFTLPAAQIIGDEGRVLALDVNPFAVKHVRGKVKHANATNVQVLVANGAETTLADQSFDLVLLFGFGHAVGDIHQIWQELHRLLAPGGTLAIEGRQQPPGGLFQFENRQRRVVRYTKVA